MGYSVLTSSDGRATEILGNLRIQFPLSVGYTADGHIKKWLIFNKYLDSSYFVLDTNIYV